RRQTTSGVCRTTQVIPRLAAEEGFEPERGVFRGTWSRRCGLPQSRFPDEHGNLRCGSSTVTPRRLGALRVLRVGGQNNDLRVPYCWSYANRAWNWGRKNGRSGPLPAARDYLFFPSIRPFSRGDLGQFSQGQKITTCRPIGYVNVTRFVKACAHR